MQPIVSVIIPTYNRANFLEKSIQSVLAQTFEDFEIIIINNYSEDNTLEVISNFKDTRIRIITFRNDGIIAKSRNQGLMHSAGKYIAFLDDDDLWLSKKLELQVDYLNKHPEYSLVYSNGWIIDVTGKRKQLFFKLGTLKQGNIFRRLVNGNFIPQLTVLMRREVFENIGFFNEDPSLKAAEDYEYWLRVALQYKIGYLDEPLAEYRVHSGGMIHTLNKAKLEQKALISLVKNFSNLSNKNKVVERIYELYCHSAVYHWKNSNKLASKEDLKKYLIWSLENFKIISMIKMLYSVIKIIFNYLYRNSKEKLKGSFSLFNRSIV